MYSFYKISIGNHNYIGKTKVINDRLKLHKHRCNNDNYAHQSLYKTIKENGGWEKCLVEVLETLEMDGKDAIRREKELIEEYQPDMNERLPDPDRPKQTYYQKNILQERVKARNKYKKTKTEWKCPQKTYEQKRELALKRIERLKKRPTDLTMEKYQILEEELDFLNEP